MIENILLLLILIAAMTACFVVAEVCCRAIEWAWSRLWP